MLFMRIQVAENAAQNWQAHSLWTGPQILKQLPEINVFCAAMGTTGRHQATSGNDKL
jgi:cysteine synthase